jgi:hypothetical protein
MIPDETHHAFSQRTSIPARRRLRRVR